MCGLVMIAVQPLAPRQQLERQAEAFGAAAQQRAHADA